MLQYFSAALLTFFVVITPSCVQKRVENNVEQQTSGELSVKKLVFPDAEGYVNDFENVFTPDEKERLSAVITDFEKRTTVQIAIVSLDDRYITADEFNAYALELARYWGVGHKEKDNGVVIAFSKKFRQIRILNGLGIEKIVSDEETEQFMQQYIIPRYKEGKYFEGTMDGLTALINILETKDLP